MQSSLPKQFLPLGDGRTVLEHSVEAFAQNAHVEEICLVVHPDWMDYARKLQGIATLGQRLSMVAGGKERWESSTNAIRHYEGHADDRTVLLIHDAARPFVCQRIIDDIHATMEAPDGPHYDAVAVGVPSTDTVWQIDPDAMTVSQIPVRATMWRAQTPQAFRYGTLREAYRQALLDPAFTATDDCGVLMRYSPSTPIHIVPGDEANKKITFQSDIQ